MYVGDIYTRAGTHNLVWEVLANAIDQHLAGHCTRIDVTLHRDGSLSVVDDGEGISVGSNNGTTWLEEILTRVHDRATADGHAPHVHLRRWHIGLSMVSALSSAMSVEVERENERWRIETSQGRVTQPPTKLGATQGRGTTVRMRADETIFRDPDFDPETLARRLRELASLLPGLVTSFSCEAHAYGPERSLAQLLDGAEIPGRRAHAQVVEGETRDGFTSARVALEWRDWPRQARIVGYCNLLPTPHGSHLEGFERGVAKALGRRDHRRVMNALGNGLNAVVSVMVIDPSFKSPTAETLDSREARDLVRDATAHALAKAMDTDPALTKFIAGRLR